MKILYLMPRSPEPATYGAQLRVHYLLQRLAYHNEVTVACFGDAGDAEKISSAIKIPPERVYVLPKPWGARHRRLGQLYAHVSNMSFLQLASCSVKMQQTIDQILAKDNFDIVFEEFAMMGWYSLKTNALKVLDAHNVENDNFRRIAQHAGLFKKWHYNHEYKHLFEEERRAYRKQDLLFVTSTRDKEIIDEFASEVPKVVLPNGVDTSYFVPKDVQPEPNSLVFTGLMKYVPNYDGVLYFLDEIFPMILKEIPDVKFYIVGSQPPETLHRRASENIIVTGFVDDVRPYVWRSKAFVVPLRMGGGTRLKVVEAMAMKKPVISTSIGCEGIEVQSGKNILIADKPAKFAQNVIDVLRDKTHHREIAENGHKLAISHYDWSIIGETMETELERFYKRHTEHLSRNIQP
ncbi:MAG: glycosyltransferase [Bacteroidota bacterium]